MTSQSVIQEFIKVAYNRIEESRLKYMNIESNGLKLAKIVCTDFSIFLARVLNALLPGFSRSSVHVLLENFTEPLYVRTEK